MPEEVSQVSTASSSVNTAEALERPAALGRCSSHQGRAVKVRQAYRFALDPSPAGKEAVSSRTRWRLPADHPDALPLAAEEDAVRVLNSPAAVLVVVAGAGNAGVSAVVETFGPRGGPPPVTQVR